MYPKQSPGRLLSALNTTGHNLDKNIQTDFIYLDFGNCVCLMKSLKNMPESLETMTDSVRLRPLF